jgi:hypothetical protein
MDELPNSDLGRGIFGFIPVASAQVVRFSDV